MKRLYTNFLTTLTFLTLVTPFTAKALSICEYGVTAGADYLYWAPCINNMHYAIEEKCKTSSKNLKYRYLNPDWDSGFRVFFQKEDLFGCFDVNLSYTCYTTSVSDSSINPAVFSQKSESGDVLTPDKIYKLSWPSPFNSIIGNRAKTKWKLDYQRADLSTGYAIDFGNRCRLRMVPFTGVDFINLCQSKRDLIEDITYTYPICEENRTTNSKLSIKREIDYCGLGPMFGMGYRYVLCEGFTTFGQISASLYVGDTKSNDMQVYESTSQKIKNKDKCFCLPGLHCQSGISYQTCVCEFDLQFRIGYEYTQLVNAPSFMLYESKSNGVISAINQNNVTLQGGFVGFGVRF